MAGFFHGHSGMVVDFKSLAVAPPQQGVGGIVVGDCHRFGLPKNSPVNGTSATVFWLMSDS